MMCSYSCVRVDGGLLENAPAVGAAVEDPAAESADGARRFTRVRAAHAVAAVPTECLTDFEPEPTVSDVGAECLRHIGAQTLRHVASGAILRRWQHRRASAWSQTDRRYPLGRGEPLNHFGEDADPRSDHDRSGLGREEANLPRREADREEGSDREEQTACSTERPSHVREEPGQEARDHPSTGQTRQAERGRLQEPHARVRPTGRETPRSTAALAVPTLVAPTSPALRAQEAEDLVPATTAVARPATGHGAPTTAPATALASLVPTLGVGSEHRRTFTASKPSLATGPSKASGARPLGALSGLLGRGAPHLALGSPSNFGAGTPNCRLHGHAGLAMLAHGAPKTAPPELLGDAPSLGGLLALRESISSTESHGAPLGG